jgi:predicted O-methyltransferase YrrM
MNILAGPWDRERVRRQGNPRYVFDKTRQMLYERNHPDAPWLTPAANRLLPSLLRPTDQGVEFGSGRSTLWLARRVAHLTSIEHDPKWYRSVAAKLSAHGITNVEQILAPVDVPVAQGGDSAYTRVLEKFPESSLDFALIDGAYRAHVTELAMPRLRPGGLMIIDNVNWYVPSPTRAPASRSLSDGPEPLWADIVRQLASWRLIWTGSGVWDTAIYIRPPNGA